MAPIDERVVVDLLGKARAPEESDEIRALLALVLYQRWIQGRGPAPNCEHWRHLTLDECSECRSAIERMYEAHK